MANTTSPFPGNPYATDSHGLTPDGAAITKAITLLAFEVRTANLLAQMGMIGKNLDGMSESGAQAWIGTAQEVNERLGGGE